MRPVRIVPHTHWDREWYLSFEEFQAQLVETIDLLLEILKKDATWTHFHLDGQTAMIDDYLELRPEREREIRELVTEGRLSCGPWVTLVDEFLVSGESIIRNLEDGIARANELGGAMLLGYLPDQFGHVGQMPQLLERFGIDRAIVWRGVPAEIDRSSFVWRGPDGSGVDVMYLPFGYGHGRKLMTAPESWHEHLDNEAARLESFLDEIEPLLVMTGGDHVRPSPALTKRIEIAGAEGTDIAITSLIEHLSSRPAAKLTWTGELRSAARANLLPNTYSVRVHQKRARARAEHLLERYAEPLAALVPAFSWPEERFKRAWALLHLNGAHDSVCGCSTDEVAQAVDGRTQEVTEIADTIARDALQQLADQVAGPGTLHFNPSPFERDGVPALGWKVTDMPPPQPRSLDVEVIDGEAIVKDGGSEFRFTLEDQGDVGDLYNFDPSGPPRPLRKGWTSDGDAHFAFDGCDVVVAASAATAGSVELDIDIDNRTPDHRLRLLLRLPSVAHESVAGSVFEVVRRPRLGEGGDSEPPSAYWPARGFVTAEGFGFLEEGVFEYELIGDALALTLLRCVGTISRYELTTRKVVAGPDVATPEAQMLGEHSFRVGLTNNVTRGPTLEEWERFALPLMYAPCSGEGSTPAEGTLLEIEGPALSSIRRQGGRTAVTIWNPEDAPMQARVGSERVDLSPGRIETVLL